MAMLKPISTHSTSRPETSSDGLSQTPYTSAYPQNFDPYETRIDHAVKKSTRDSWFNTEKLIKKSACAGVIMLAAQGYHDPAEKENIDFSNAYTVLTKKFSHINIYSLSIESSAQKWLYDFYKNSVDAKTAKELYPLVEGITSYFKFKKYNLLNQLMLEIDLHLFSPNALVTLLRATYPAKHKLENWKICYHLVERRLEALGENPAARLKGLVV